ARRQLMLHTLVETFANMEWLELSGLISGLLCVWLLVRGNVWTFPVGLVYALISVAVFFKTRLYADVVLNGYYVLMNAYGWYYWLYGGREALTASVPVRRASSRVMLLIVCAIGVGTLLVGTFFSRSTDADLPYWDSLIVVASFAAMWLTARKYIDNWTLWFAVDIVATGVYLAKGIEFYAILYAIYLILAIVGWRTWARELTPASSSA
ncbi:MAG: nicotinamide riboside transporter PnuC, partial [Pseudomonadales bacterium]